jgi:hypothetical protein
MRSKYDAIGKDRLMELMRAGGVRLGRAARRQVLSACSRGQQEGARRCDCRPRNRDWVEADRAANFVNGGRVSTELPGGQNMKIHALQTGTVRVKASQAVGRGRGSMRQVNILLDRSQNTFSSATNSV